MSEAWQGFEVNQIRVDYRLELFMRHNSKIQGDHEVSLSMALQDGDVLVAASCLRDRHEEKESTSTFRSQGCPQLTFLVFTSTDGGLNKIFSRFTKSIYMKNTV